MIFWLLPDGQRAELIDGQIYDMGTPTKTHQDILGYLFLVYRAIS